MSKHQQISLLFSNTLVHLAVLLSHKYPPSIRLSIIPFSSTSPSLRSQAQADTATTYQLLHTLSYTSNTPTMCITHITTYRCLHSHATSDYCPSYLDSIKRHRGAVCTRPSTKYHDIRHVCPTCEDELYRQPVRGPSAPRLPQLARVRGAERTEKQPRKPRKGESLEESPMRANARPAVNDPAWIYANYLNPSSPRTQRAQAATPAASKPSVSRPSGSLHPSREQWERTHATEIRFERERQAIRRAEDAHRGRPEISHWSDSEDDEDDRRPGVASISSRVGEAGAKVKSIVHQKVERAREPVQRARRSTKKTSRTVITSCIVM